MEKINTDDAPRRMVRKIDSDALYGNCIFVGKICCHTSVRKITDGPNATPPIVVPNAGTCNFFQVTGQIATQWNRGPDNGTHVNEG